jgi:hypothetical protein
MRRAGDEESGRLEDEERGRGFDGEMGRLGEFLFLCSPFFLLPSSDGHRTDIRYIRYIRRWRIRCRTSF